MLGIRVARDTQDEKFMRYFEIVQRAANKQGCVFFCDSGESHELINDLFDGEDLSGWLVPASEAEEFNERYLDWNVGEESDELTCIAQWYGDERAPSIRFITW